MIIHLNVVLKMFFSLIDVNNDRTLTKDEFIDGVLKNPYLSDIISPFNE